MIPKISVVVPCYNQGKYLSEALDSVLAQSLQEWECIVVDDGSTDNSADVAKAYCAKDNRIRYVYQENAGPSAARNKGVSKTSAPLLFFLDGDNVILSELLGLGVEHMKKHTDCILYYTKGEYYILKDDKYVLAETAFDPEETYYRYIDCPKILFPWHIGGEATAAPGITEFSVRFYRLDDTKTHYAYSLNTKTASSRVLDGMDTTEE